MGFGLHSFQKNPLSILECSLLSTTAYSEFGVKGLWLHPPVKPDSLHEEHIIRENLAFVSIDRRQQRPLHLFSKPTLDDSIPVASYTGDSRISLEN